MRGSVSRLTLAVCVVLSWVRSAGEAGALVALGWALDLLRQGEEPRPAIVAFLCCSAATVLTTVDTLVISSAQARAETRLRTATVAAFFAGDAASLSRAEKLPSLNDSVERAAHYRAGFLAPTVGTFTTPLVVLAVMAIFVDPVLAAALTLMVVVLPVIIGVAQRLLRRSGGENRRQRARLSAMFLRNVQGLSTLVAHGAAGRAASQLQDQGQRQRRSMMGLLARNQRLILVIDVCITFGLLLVTALVAAARVRTGSMSIGAAVAAVLICLLVGRPADSVGKFFYIGVGGRAAEAALSGHFSTPDPVTDPAASPQLRGQQGAEGDPTATGENTASGRTAATGSPDLDLVEVTAGWDAERPVVSGLNLRVMPGEHVALVGPSGVGKSTVAALISATLRPLKGHTRVRGLDTAEAVPRHVRRHLSVVEQRTFLFQETIAANLRLAAPNASDEALWRALEAAGLLPEVRSMPAGLQTPVGEHGLTLSGGQSQRLALARAFLRDAPILVLDEPTSQVDLAGEASFLDSLQRLCRDKSVLMIAHRPGAILAADRTVTLTPQGAVAMSPAASELIEASELQENR